MKSFEFVRQLFRFVLYDSLLMMTIKVRDFFPTHFSANKLCWSGTTESYVCHHEVGREMESEGKLAAKANKQTNKTNDGQASKV